MLSPLQFPYSDLLAVSVEHYHDDDGEAIPFLECGDSPEEFARVGQTKTVAIYKLLKVVTVSAEVKVEDSEAL